MVAKEVFNAVGVSALGVAETVPVIRALTLEFATRLSVSCRSMKSMRGSGNLTAHAHCFLNTRVCYLARQDRFKAVYSRLWAFARRRAGGRSCADRSKVLCGRFHIEKRSRFILDSPQLATHSDKRSFRLVMGTSRTNTSKHRWTANSVQNIGGISE
jgi:hypothetical protein